MRNLSLLFAFLFFMTLGCQGTQPSQAKSTVIQTNQQVSTAQAAVTPSHTESPLRLVAGSEELTFGGSTHRIDSKDSADLLLPDPPCYVYVFQRRGAQMQSKIFTPADNERKMSVRDMETGQEFTQNTDWFVWTSLQPLADLEQLKAKVLSAGGTAQAQAGNIYPKTVRWRLYQLENVQGQSNALTNLEIQSSPVALHMYVQKPGRSEFQEHPCTEAIAAGDKLQLKLEAYRDAHVAVFLYGDSGQTTTLLFPENGTDSVAVKAKTVVDIPSHKQGVAMDATQGRSLYVFSGNQPVACANLQKELPQIESKPESRVPTEVVSFESTTDLPHYFRFKLESK